MDAKRKELIAQYKQRKRTGGVFRIYHKDSGRSLLLAESDLNGSRNRFEFSVLTGSCVHHPLSKDWEKYGGNAFCFEILEEIEKKAEETEKEFSESLQVLLELWKEKFDVSVLY